MTIVNKKGDKGHPYLKPFVELKYPKISPLQIIEKGISCKQALTQSIKRGGRPNWDIQFKIDCLLIVTNAFLRSNFA